MTNTIARNEIESEAQLLAARARRLFSLAAEHNGGRCLVCRGGIGGVVDFANLPKGVQPTPEGECCPMRHFVGQVAVGFRVLSDLPIRRKNAIERRLWAMFPGVRDDLKTAA